MLEGEDLSGEVEAWIDDVIERIVTQHTETDFAEEWNLDSLVTAMQALYRTDITVDELREDVELSREALIDEFREDAREEYNTKQEELGPDLMRELERFVILQMVDQRWREHLENMDYLREGVHLRSMAQKDPLVEYTAEGHSMFEELNTAIREEVVMTLFHAELAPGDADELQAAQSGSRNGGPLAYEHESLAGADAIAAAGAVDGNGGGRGSVATAGLLSGGGTAVATTQRVASEQDKIGRNDPCWCGSGKKFKKCHGA